MFLIGECYTQNDVDDFAEDIYEEKFGRIIHSSVVGCYYIFKREPIGKNARVDEIISQNWSSNQTFHSKISPKISEKFSDIWGRGF